ncbi:peroxiredoxin [Kocuria palustris]|nr:peroxiredoxin [Kocuria palustris]
MVELRRSLRSSTQESTKALEAQGLVKRLTASSDGGKKKKAKKEVLEDGNDDAVDGKYEIAEPELDAVAIESKKERENGEKEELIEDSKKPEELKITDGEKGEAGVENDGDEDDDDDDGKDTEEIEVGDEIPDIKLVNQDGKEISTKEEITGSKYNIVFSYPKASTPGCTRQAQGFRDNHDFYEKHGVKVFGLSADTPKAQTNFINKYLLNYDLWCDPKKQLIEVLGAKKSPSGTKRSHWIFKDGKLVDKKIQISPENSVKEARNWIENDIGESPDQKNT